MTDTTKNPQVQSALEALAEQLPEYMGIDRWQEMLPGALFVGEYYFTGRNNDDDGPERLVFEVFEATLTSQSPLQTWTANIQAVRIVQLDDDGCDELHVTTYFGGYLSEGSAEKAFLDWYMLRKLACGACIWEGAQDIKIAA